jgi:hypothetical protein
MLKMEIGSLQRTPGGKWLRIKCIKHKVIAVLRFSYSEMLHVGNHVRGSSLLYCRFAVNDSEYIFPSILITDRHTEIRLDQLLFGHLVYNACKCGKDVAVSVLCAFII